MHISVGAIIRSKGVATRLRRQANSLPAQPGTHSNWNQDDKILMIDRAYFPFGWACPAGHIDKNETPEQALIREVKEETNLDIRPVRAGRKYKLLIHEYVDWNECIHKVKGHDWYVYEVGEWQGEVEQNKHEEKAIGWFSQDQIKKLKLEEIWQYWFKKLKII